MRYLRDIVDLSLYYDGAKINLQGYVDIDMTVDLDDRKHTIGYIFISDKATMNSVSILQFFYSLDYSRVCDSYESVQ